MHSVFGHKSRKFSLLHETYLFIVLFISLYCTGHRVALYSRQAIAHGWHTKCSSPLNCFSLFIKKINLHKRDRVLAWQVVGYRLEKLDTF